MTEWEKRLASSHLRGVDDSPMIEPLESDEVRTEKQRTLSLIYSISYQTRSHLLVE